MSIKINLQKESVANTLTRSLLVGTGTYISPTGAGEIVATSLLGNIDASQVASGTLDAARLPLGLGSNTAPATGSLLIGTGTGYSTARLTAGSNITISNTAGGIEISSAASANLVYRGLWNASTNVPHLVSSVGTGGDYYLVSVAGSTDLNGISSWIVGDLAIFNGLIWQKISSTDQVTSVFGRVGAIVALAGDYSASQVTNVPYLSITATNVQSALNQLEDRINLAEQVLTAYITNGESVAITRGQVVYISGATGNRPTVRLASNTSEATSSKTFGVVSEASIGAGNPGYVTCVGVVENLNLGSYAEGAMVYLGATPGSITTTKPAAPSHLVYVGLIQRANNGNGQLYVKIQNGYELDELHDVQITGTPVAGSLIIRNATTSLWQNATLTAGTGMTVSNGDASITLTPNFASPPPIGNTTANTGAFTTLTATSAVIPTITAATSVTTPYVTAPSGVYLTLGGGSNGATVTVGQGTNGSITLTPKGTGTVDVVGSITGTWAGNILAPALFGTAVLLLSPSNATPTINVTTTSLVTIHGLSVDVTFTLTGTPVNGQKLLFRIQSNGGAHDLNFGPTCISRTAQIPTITVPNKYTLVGFMFNQNEGLWDCIAAAQET